MKIFKRIPWDFHPTYGGAAVLVILVAIMSIVASWVWFNPPFIVMLPSLVFNILLLAWFVHNILGPPYAWWYHFIGTNVDFKSQERFEAAQHWCWANSKFSNEFEYHHLAPTIPYTVRFRRRDKAMMAQLSV